ncbi:cora-like Mg2+ transporter protein-domain-containing protein, partial [Pisolithus sp. B1]
RHAAPSAPWPWMDFDVDKSAVEPSSDRRSSDDWSNYPQNLFGNWTKDQVERSEMLTRCSHSQSCLIYNVEMGDDGLFDKNAGEKPTAVTAESTQAIIPNLKVRPEGIRIRAFFVDNLSLNVLKMLGTTQSHDFPLSFNIEPFFFSSSTNRIPSRYQEDAKAGVGDHITVILPFVCVMRETGTRPGSIPHDDSADALQKATRGTSLSSHDTLLEDLLAIHMVRGKDSSTIISYHPISHLKETSANRLRSLVERTGDSVYWSKLFKKFEDPTFVFLAILWYALYAWDEAFEVLYQHIIELESRVLGTNDVVLTQELHKLQAYLLHYKQLLRDFHKSVEFVKKTPNPAVPDDDGEHNSARHLKREVDNLLSEIDRLESQRTMQSDRLDNVMRLVGACLNAQIRPVTMFARHLQPRAMKRVSYLTMIFLPASLIAGVFGMNVVEINSGSHETLVHYVEATITLTALTVWLVVAFQTESSFWPKGSPRWRRLAWPIFFVATPYLRHRRAPQRDEHDENLRSDLDTVKNIPAESHGATGIGFPWFRQSKNKCSSKSMRGDRERRVRKPLYPDGLVSPSDYWKTYPQNLFGNWTPDQVLRSRMLTSCSDTQPCLIYNVEVKDDGHFDKTAGEKIITRPEGIRIRAFFVNNLSLNVLKMLGTTYNVEPFFFSSSTNWIPSRYQEDAKLGVGDHITVTLPFICTMRKPGTRPASVSSIGSVKSLQKTTHASEILLQDLLAIHMVRRKESSTIISYHPISHLQKTSAKRLQSLVQRTGDSVYWSKLFDRSKDPTFVFLAILWYALYAWDESFEVLYRHINKLESKVLGTNDINLTRELHKVQAYLLYYQQLLQDFHKSVDFVKLTPNPAMHGDEDEASSAALLEREVDNLLSEIGRLEGQRTMQSDRLKNVMQLVDSRAMKKLTEASMRDSAAMKQISYLTMIFLPASLIASVFGMNVAEINPGTYETLNHYAEVTVSLTVLTAWLVIAMQTESSFWPKGSPWWRRLAWPIYFTAARVKKWCSGRRREPPMDEQPTIIVVTPPDP